MRRVPLESTALASVGYDDERAELELSYRGGRVYRFFGVPRGVFELLLRAKSKGGYAHRMIEKRYPYEEVTAVEPEPDLEGALRASLRDDETAR